MTGTLKALLALEWVKLKGARGPRLATSAVGLVVLITCTARYAGGAPATGVLRSSLDSGFALLLSYALPFLLASGTISEEVSGRTLIYLTARPIPRGQIALGKWCLAAGTAGGLLLLGSLATHVGCFVATPGALVEHLPTTLRAAGSLCLLAAYLCGACTLWSALAPSAASILCTLHLAGELALSLAPGRLRLLSASHHARELAALPRRGLWGDLAPALPTAAHAAVLVLACLVVVGASASTMRQREYRGEG